MGAVVTKGLKDEDVDVEVYRQMAAKEVRQCSEINHNETTRKDTDDDDVAAGFGSHRPMQIPAKPHGARSANKDTLIISLSKNVKLYIYTADLLKIKGINMIVCANIPDGKGKGVLSEALRKAGGSRYTNMIDKEFKMRTVKEGDVIVCKCNVKGFDVVAHAILVKRRHVSGSEDRRQQVNSIFLKIFQEASRWQCSSIALPLLGTGLGGADPVYYTERLLESLVGFADRSQKQLEVHLVNHDPAKTATAVAVIASITDMNLRKDSTVQQTHQTPKSPNDRFSITTYGNRNHKQPSHPFSSSVRDSKGTNAMYSWGLQRKPSGSTNKHRSNLSRTKTSTKGSKAETAIDYENSKFLFDTRHYDEGPDSPSASQGSLSDDDEEEVNDCVICLDSVSDPKKLPCRHVFCRDCIDQLFKHKKACPTCGQICGIITEQSDIGDFDNVDPIYFNAYIEALKDGKEKTNSIRINVVGNAWVGKSTLTKNLLGMIPDRNIDRTDGIDVHCYTCNDSSDWSSKDVPSDEKTAQRIAMSSEAMQSKEHPIERGNINTSHIVHQPNQTEIKTRGIPSDDEIVPAFSQTSLSKSLPTNDEYGPLLTIPTDDLNINVPEKERISIFSSEVRINETEKERINMFSSKLKKGHLTDVTFIQIWDFGGQFDYYATHQLFHSQRAVYLLVLDASADLNDITETCELTNASGDKDVKYFCKFWMHSIHSFVGNDKHEPPVILVATKTDKKSGWNEEKQKEFFQNVRQLFDGTPVGYHIQSKCFAVNNFSEDAADFKNLRKYIEEVAKSQDSWNSTVPARWIPLEDSLSRRTSEKHLTLQQIRTIGSELNVPINDEPQIKAFLMYHHSLGNLVYFDDDDLSESTVIDPQWIIDAFKTIITAKTKEYCLENGPLRDKWEQLTNEAILSKELIKAVWNIDNENDFSSNEDMLLKYLIKLGIISEVTELDMEKHIEDHKDYFLVPSLLNAKSSRLCLEQLMESRTVTQTALVFEFKDKHVPLLLHHRLTAAALGKWNVLVFRDQRMLAEHIGVYKLDEVHAGLIEVCDTSIEILVVNLCGKYINPTQTDKLRRFVRSKIDAEFQRFSKTKTSPYTLRIRCNLNNNKGKQTIELSKIENSEYDSLPCPDNDIGHDIRTTDIRNQWSYPELNVSRDKNDKELLKSLRDDSKRDLTLSVTEREFSKIAYALGFNWELLGIDLGLSNATIEQIKMDNPYSSNIQIFQMLKTWADREAEEATMEKLLAAIVDEVDMTVDWDKIRNILDE